MRKLILVINLLQLLKKYFDHLIVKKNYTEASCIMSQINLQFNIKIFNPLKIIILKFNPINFE